MRVKRRSAPISRIPAPLGEANAVLVTGPPHQPGGSRPVVPRAVPLTFLLAGGLAVAVLYGSGALRTRESDKPVRAVSPSEATVLAPLPRRSVSAKPGEPELAQQFRHYLASRPGHASVAIYDAVTGETVAVDDPSVDGFETASTVKLAIAVELLKQAGPAGQLSPAERRTATAMIGVSDNAAASRLWSAVGGSTAMDGLFRRLGMTSTVAGIAGYWGLTRTTAADQIALLRTVAYPNHVLSRADRAVAKDLLDGVIPTQRWGVPDGVPPAVSVEVKNGWLPRADGWVINSIGHVHGAGRDYVIAAYTRNDPSMRSGIDTVAGLSALAWKAVAVESTPSSRR